LAGEEGRTLVTTNRHLYLDGKLVPYADARIHVQSTAVKYGGSDGRYALGARGGRGDAARIGILKRLEWAAAKLVPVGEEIVLVAEKPVR
jgi:hypothetical protein